MTVVSGLQIAAFIEIIPLLKDCQHVRSHLNSLQTTRPHFSKIYFAVVLPSGPFLPGFLGKILYAFCFPSYMYASCHNQHILNDLKILQHTVYTTVYTFHNIKTVHYKQQLLLSITNLQIYILYRKVCKSYPEETKVISCHITATDMKIITKNIFSFKGGVKLYEYDNGYREVFLFLTQHGACRCSSATKSTISI